MGLSDLPTLNAFLNGTAAVLLLVGRNYIRRGERQKHRKCMIGAFSVSSLFLISYLFYHYNHGSQPFLGSGWIRPVYFTILISHTILAAAVVPMVLLTLRRGLKSEFSRHKKIARWTYPVWLYVSVTGVIIYLMLYQLSPAMSDLPVSAIVLLSSFA